MSPRVRLYANEGSLNRRSLMLAGFLVMTLPGTHSDCALSDSSNSPGFPSSPYFTVKFLLIITITFSLLLCLSFSSTKHFLSHSCQPSRIQRDSPAFRHHVPCPARIGQIQSNVPHFQQLSQRIYFFRISVSQHQIGKLINK